MEHYTKQVEVRWSDLDPNFHLRHSAYYDYGAYSRMCFFNDHNLTPQLLLQHKIGPILFREECVFKREIHFGDHIEINLQLKKTTYDISRWTIVHEIVKNKEKVAAIITVEGAWMDTALRKLTAPPKFILDAFINMEKAPEFEWIEKKV